jgi:hypothetical protein
MTPDSTANANYGIYADRDWPLSWKRNGKDNCVLEAIQALQHLAENLRDIGENALYTRERLHSIQKGLLSFGTDLELFFSSGKPYPFDAKTWEWHWLRHGYMHSLPATEEALLYLSGYPLQVPSETLLKKRLLERAQALETTRKCLLDVPEAFVDKVTLPASSLPDQITIQDMSARISEAQNRHFEAIARWARERLQRTGLQSASGGSGGKSWPTGQAIVVTAGGEGSAHASGGGNGGALNAVRGGAGGMSQAYAGGSATGVGGFGFVRGSVAYLEPDDTSRQRRALELGKDGTARYIAVIKAAIDTAETSGQVGEAEALRDIRALLLPNPD